MIVYRVCKKNEIDKIFEDNNFQNVGSNYYGTTINNHDYDVEKKYLHFFQNIDSILFLKTLKDRYLCVYDIPDNILNENVGIGHYWDFINYSDLKEALEYAISTDILTMDNLKQIYYIKNEIDYEELLENDIDSFIDIVYNKSAEEIIQSNQEVNKTKIISHYSLLGTLSTRPVVKGTKKIVHCSTEDYSNLFADLKREQLKLLTKEEQTIESDIVLNHEEQGPIRNTK